MLDQPPGKQIFPIHCHKGLYFLASDISEIRLKLLLTVIKIIAHTWATTSSESKMDGDTFLAKPKC